MPDFNSGVNDIIRIYADVNFDMTTYWDDFDLSEIKTTDTAGNYRFDYSVISGSYTAKITDPSKVLYNTTPNITKTGGTGDYTAPVPTLNINETNNSLTIEKRIQYLYGLVIPPPVPAIAQPSCIFNGFSGNDGTKQLEISWTNNSFPVTWADISTDNFTTYYHKEIKSGNSTTGADGITRIDGTGFNDADGAANGDLGTLTYNPGTTYSVRLFNGGLNNDPPYPYFTPTICVPPKPTIVNSTCDSPGYSASMSWTASTGATAYALRINNKANGWCADGGGSCNYGNTGTNHNCTNFTGDYCLSFNGTTYSYNTTPGNSYDWWVHACNNAGCSQESQESTASFTCSYAKDPWIQVTGDVHSNTRIKAPGGP